MRQLTAQQKLLKRRFTSKRKIGRDGYRTALTVENQQFSVTPFDLETESEAEWYRDMLAIALSNVVNDRRNHAD